MSRRFKPDAAFERELRRQPEFREALRTVAATVVDGAAALAPNVSGDYVGSLKVVEDGDIVAAATTDPAGHLVEFGSVKNPAYAPLRRATRAAGLRLDESPPQ